MTAYSIFLGTLLFGNTVFGVKFMAVVWWFFTNMLLYNIVKNHIEFYKLDSSFYKLPFYSLIIYNLTVIGSLYSITIVPDTPLMFFWFLIVYSVQKVILNNKKIWWLVAGVSLGFALMSKYSAIIITGSLFLFLLFSKEYRKLLLTPYPYLSILIGILVFSPVIYWNYANEWASFKYQFSERASKAKPLQIKYFLQLVISQFFLLTPLIFLWCFSTVYHYIKNWKTNRKLDLFFFTGIPIIIIFALISFKSLVKMNWLLPGYISLIVMMAFTHKHNLEKLTAPTKVGLGISLFLVFLGHFILVVPNVPLGEANTWSGWKDASQQIYKLQKEYGGRNNCFIFGNSYKSASLVKFYLPDQQPTYAENIFGERGLQFDYWEDPAKLYGKNALYVFDNRKEYKPELEIVEKYFDEIREVKKFEYNFFGIAKTRTITCYYCVNYHETN